MSLGNSIFLGSLTSRLVLFSLIVALQFAPTYFAAETKTIPIERSTRSERVSFHREILPLLQANCLPCHNQTRAKGELSLETPASMIKGGDSGPALVRGKPSESRLLQAAAHQLEDLVMPPVGNKVNARNLRPDELGLLALWIEQGAQMEAVEAVSFDWHPIPTNWVSSFAVALTGDGDLVAVARANRIFLYETGSGRLIQELASPDLRGTAQRDWVSALAFNPGGETLAAGGFREVRLWRKNPVTIEPAWPSSTTFVAAAISPDRKRVAVVTPQGEVEIRNLADGTKIRSWELHAKAPVRIAWSGENDLLALAGGDGALQVISTRHEEKPLSHAFDREIAAFAWFDHGRQLATVLPDKSVIQTWRIFESPESPQIATNLISTGERNAGATVTSLATGVDGSFVSASTDGLVRQYFADATVAPRDLHLKSSIAGLDYVGSGARFAARLASGGASLVTFTDATNTVAGNFGGDPRISKNVSTLEAELALSRVELARATTLVTEAETAAKANDETIRKAREKREANAKAFTEKEKELKQQRDVETASAKERDDLTAELQRITDSARAADKAMEEARATAKLAAEKEGAAQVAASAAERLKSELDRLLASLPESDTSEAAAKTREAGASASTEAAARAAQRAEATARAEQARDELASRAFAAGERTAEKKRADADLPPRKKQAEERFAAAQKSVKALQPQFEKARITLDGSTQDVALADKALAQTNQALEESKAARDAAQKRISATETQIADARSMSERASALGLTASAASTSAASLLTLSADGVANQWALTSRVATASFTLRAEAPLAIVGTGEQEFIAVFSNAVLRIDTTCPWTLQRTIGSSEPGSPSGPFVDRVNALAFSPDGKLLATGGGEPSRAGELKIWRVSDGELTRDLGGIHSDSVMAAAFSPRGESLATGGADRFARITPLSGDGPRLNLEGHTQHVLDVAWLADGSALATAGAEGVVKIWNPKTADRRKNVEGFGKEVTGLESLGTTSQFVAVSGSGQGRIFRADGEKVRDLAPAPVFLQAMAVSRNGSLIAAAGDDGKLHLWNPETGKTILTIPPR